MPEKCTLKDKQIQSMEELEDKGRQWCKETMQEFKEMYGTGFWAYLLFNWDDELVFKAMKYAYLQGALDGIQYADNQTVEMIKEKMGWD